MVLISCNSKEKKSREITIPAISVQSNVPPVPNIHEDENSLVIDYIQSENIQNDELTDIDFNVDSIKIARVIDDDMIKNVIAVYKPESDTIINIDEIEPDQILIDILNKPFENLELCIFSESSNKRVFNGITELFDIFNISVSQNNLDRFNSIGLYKNIKITIENLTLYVYYEGNTYYKLFIVEYNNDYIYEPKLKTSSTKDDIIKTFGNPSAYSDERNIFIYQSNKTGRQINIFFENDKVNYIQLISWGGI
jgi:hypothetical protein